MSDVVVFDRFGGPEVLRIVSRPTPEPAADEVILRIEAFAVNPLDAMMRSGTSPAPVPLPGARLGIEATGVVEATGVEVADLRIGDPVIVTALPDPSVSGAYAERIAIPAGRVISRPAGLDVEQSAAVWVAFSTAYGALLETARMRPADRLLVSGASGAVGRAALQIADRIGAQAIALTRDAAKTDELIAAGATAVVVTEREDVVSAVRRLTDGRGADLAFDLVRGPGQSALREATRSDGMLVAAGYLDPRPTPEAGASPVRVVGYRGFDTLGDPAAVARMAAFLGAGVRQGDLLPAIDAVLPFDEVVEAHRRFDAGAHGGRKIVVRVP